MHRGLAPVLGAFFLDISEVLIEDDVGAWSLGPDGAWTKVTPERGSNAQQRLQELAVERTAGGST